MSNTIADQKTASPDEDSALVSSCKEGDLNAFEALVGKYQKRMFNTAFRLAGDYEDAAEIVQDAFMAAYRNIRRFKGEAKFSTWLTAITINHAKNRLKQIKARHSREIYSIDNPVETDDGRVAPDPPSHDPSVLDRLEKKDVQRKVQDCIKALEPEFREALVLRDMQDFSYEEIGGMLNVREGTVKSRLFRAREAVKDCLKRAMGELL